jgi:hypothetical protein
MSSDLQLATKFLDALTSAAASGERDPVFVFLAPDVEWVVPQRTLHGLEDVRLNHSWGLPPESFDVEFERDECVELGGGRLTVTLREAYRWKRTGEVAHRRARRIELTVRDGEISRYEMQVVG